MNTQSASLAQSPHMLDFISHSPAQTIRIGYRLGELLRRGDVVLLLGEFGVGKTHLIKGIAQGLGSNDLVNSPSFVLINEYRAGARHGQMPIYHVDLYRVESTAELVGLGLEDVLADDGVCLIEWAERAEDWVPSEHLTIHLRHLSETKRVLRFEPQGARYLALVEEFKRNTFA